MRRRRRTWEVLLLTVAIVVAMPALAAAACSGLTAADPTELLNLPTGTGWAFDWLPPGVDCTQEGLDRMPPLCTCRSTITVDRMLGDRRRLLLLHTAQADGAQWEYLSAFGCVAGQVRRVLQYRFRPGAAIAHADAAKIVVQGSDQPDAAPRRIAFFWNEQAERYESYAGVRATPRSPSARSCGELATIGSTELLAVGTEDFPHGMGCYSWDPEEHPDQCEWEMTLATDRMIGDDRRLIVVGRNHLGGSGAWGDVFVFGCIEGHLGTLFHEMYEYGPADVDVTTDAVTILAPGWANDPHCCPSRADRLMYGWSPHLQSYVLRRVHFAPRSRATLHETPPPTSTPTSPPAAPLPFPETVPGAFAGPGARPPVTVAPPPR